MAKPPPASNKPAAEQWADLADYLEAKPEDPCTEQVRQRLEHWQAVAKAPWERPETISDAVRLLQGRRTIWLIEAIDKMAFGTAEPPQEDIEAGARRLQACRALCLAAADGFCSLVGVLGENSERVETIPAAVFSSDYRIGRGSNVLELDASSVQEKDDAKFDRLHLGRWFDVRIGDKAAFLAWLASPFATPKARFENVPAPNRDRKGQGSFAALDEPFLAEMEGLIVGRKVASVQAAAARVADRAHGGGGTESKARRLARAYGKSGRQVAP